MAAGPTLSAHPDRGMLSDSSMKPYLSASRAKALAVAVAVVFLTLASFGLGVSVGSRRSPDLAALPAHAEQASAVNDAVQIVNEGNGAPPLLDLNYFREAYGLLQKQFYGCLLYTSDAADE